MSAEHTSPLHQHLHKRFKEVFGKPDNSLGRDDHWAFFPTPNSVSINVLVNGTAQTPAVWVFDPHSRDDGGMRSGIEGEDDLIEVVKQIQARVKRAGQQDSAG